LNRRPPEVIERLRALTAFAVRCPWTAPCTIAAFALLLRLHGLGSKPFWLDEVATLRRATMPLSSVAVESLRNNHYPPYFLLLWLVAKVSASPWLLRLPSAIFGAIAAGLVCVLGREVDGPRTGIAAGLLLALSPFDVQYGQEARPYTLVAALILLAMWGLARLARDPVGVARPFRSSGQAAVPWIAYCAGTAAALNVLNVAAGWLVAANLAAIVIAHDAGDRRGAFLRRWGIAQALVIAAWLPALVAVCVVTKGAIVDATEWAPSVTIASIWAVAAPVYLQRIGAFITFDLLPVRVPGLSAAIAVLAAYGAWRLRRRPAVLAAIGCAAVALPLLLVLLSLGKPLMVPRYFGWSAAPFFVLAGAGLGRLPRVRFAGVATVLAAACLINLWPYYHAETKPRWDLAAKQLALSAHDGDVVLLNSWYADYVMTAFAKRSGLAERQVLFTADPAAAAAGLAPHHDLWVIFGRAGQARLPSPEHYLGSLSALGRPVSEQRFGRYIMVWRFVRDEVAAGCPSAPTCGKEEGSNQP
jgi:mannosyltransferase